MAAQNVLFDLALGYALVLAVPGPSALAIARSSLTGSHRVSLATALGVASGAGLAGTVAAIGAAAVPVIGLWSRLGALCLAALLCRSAIGLVRNRPRPPGSATLPPQACPAAFAVGIAAALANPVSIPWFLVFFLSHHASPETGLLACGLIFAMAVTWFGLLGCAIIRLCNTTPNFFRNRTIQHAIAAGCLFIAARTVWAGFGR